MTSPVIRYTVSPDAEPITLREVCAAWGRLLAEGDLAENEAPQNCGPSIPASSAAVAETT